MLLGKDSVLVPFSAIVKQVEKSSAEEEGFTAPGTVCHDGKAKAELGAAGCTESAAREKATSAACTHIRAQLILLILPSPLYMVQDPPQDPPLRIPPTIKMGLLTPTNNQDDSLQTFAEVHLNLNVS